MCARRGMAIVAARKSAVVQKRLRSERCQSELRLTASSSARNVPRTRTTQTVTNGESRDT